MVASGCGVDDRGLVPFGSGNDLTDDPRELADHARQLMDQGHTNLDFNTYASAAPYLQRLIDLEPANKQRVIDMARFLAGQHNFHPKGQSRLKGNRDAIKLLEKALRTFPDDADIHAELARNLAQGGIDRCVEAIPHFRRAIEQHPTDGSLHSDIAACAYAKQDYETAVREFEIALPMLDPVRDALALFRAREFLGKTYQAMGRWKDAERELKESSDAYEKWVALNGNPNYWGCPFQSLGALYTKTDHRRAADDAYVKSADYQPLKWQTQINAAIRAYQYGDYQKARQLAERALAANPDLPDVRVLRGFITLALRDTDEAERVFTWQNAEVWPPFSRRFDATYGARVGLAHLAIAEHREDDALRLAEKLVDGPYTWQTRAWTWFEHRALSHIETYDPFEANELNRFYYQMACLAGAWAHSNKREHEAALPYYERILAQDRRHLLALLGKANALNGMKRPDDAERVYAQVLRVDPGNAFALAEIGVIHYTRGNNAQAEKYFNEALANGGETYSCPYEGLGLVYLRAGKIDKAEDFLEKAIEMSPDHEHKKFNALAKIRIREGKFTEAAELLRQSIKIFPYGDEAPRLLKSIDSMSASRPRVAIASTSAKTTASPPPSATPEFPSVFD